MSYSQCWNCGWLYTLWYRDFESYKLYTIGNEKYCPLCEPSNNMENEDKIINEERRELARVIHMLPDSPTPEQIEQELQRERASIVDMTHEQLEQHILELDDLYKNLQIESKKIKTRTIAALETKREKFGTKKPSGIVKKPKNEDEEMNNIALMMEQLKNTAGSKLKKV